MVSKSTTLQFRCSSDEKSTWEFCAKESGKSLSQWVRGKLNERAEFGVHDTRRLESPGTCELLVGADVIPESTRSILNLMESLASDRGCSVNRVLLEALELMDPAVDGPELVRGRELDQTHKMERRGRGPVVDRVLNMVVSDDERMANRRDTGGRDSSCVGDV